MIIPPGTAMGTPVVPEPVKKPMAETVSLEVVWAAAFTGVALTMEHPLYKYETEHAVGVADRVVAALLAAFPRGGQ